MLLTDFGAKPADQNTNQGGTDCSPLLLEAIAQSVKTGDYVLNIPQGKWRFSSPVHFPSRLLVIGSGLMNPGERGSILIADFDGQDFLTFDGFTPFGGGGSGLMGLTIYKGLNRSGGRAVVMRTLSPTQRDGWFRMQNVLIGGYDYSGFKPATWDECLFLDGTATPNPPGCRDGWIRDCSFSAATSTAVQIMGGCGLSMSDNEIFEGQGTSGDLLISGSAAVPSQIVSWHGGWVMGAVTFGYVDGFIFSGYAQNLQVMDTVAMNGLIDVVGLQGAVMDSNRKARKDGSNGVYTRVGR